MVIPQEQLPIAHENWKSKADGVPRLKVILSDLHLSAGLFWGGERNPHEDFYFDDELCDLLRYFSTGIYGGDYDVELILNGDIFDFLNVPVDGDFPDVITEDLAVWKLQTILQGHPQVHEALRAFAREPGKTITYVVGNHDADFLFPKVQETFINEISNGEGKVRIVDEESMVLDGGIEIHHGHNFEAIHRLNYEKPFLTKWLKEPILNVPWGSLYVMKIVNRLKRERDYVDKVRPVKLFLLYSLFTDTLFTLKYVFLSTFYFLKTRFIYDPRRRSPLKTTFSILKEETQLWDDGESAARKILEEKPEIQAVIMGHTHLPRYAVYGDGRIFVNTGTWTKMVNLDLRRFGNSVKQTFALVEYDGSGGRPKISLMNWKGKSSPFNPYLG
jgi:UDP-2,3-diacylglucosamine pyrophosphatase LpxH